MPWNLPDDLRFVWSLLELLLSPLLISAETTWGFSAYVRPTPHTRVGPTPYTPYLIKVDRHKITILRLKYTLRISSPSRMASTSSNSSGKLRELQTFITGHNAATGNTTIQDRRSAEWQSYDHGGMAFHVPFTTSSFPVSMKNDEDIETHDRTVASGKLGIVNPNGTVLRFVDFAPLFESMMHRTRSLDYGIVVEGSIELVLDSGERQVLGRGDVCVQRGTNHAWRNPSDAEWARVVYILQDSQPVEVGGERLKEYLGRSEGEIPGSGNDA